jgi:hypothetical protein
MPKLPSAGTFRAEWAKMPLCHAAFRAGGSYVLYSKRDKTVSFSSHALLVLVTPPVVTLSLCWWLKTPRSLVALLYLSVPLVASVAMVILFPERDYSVVSASFVRAVLGIYIMACFLSALSLHFSVRWRDSWF